MLAKKIIKHKLINLGYPDHSTALERKGIPLHSSTIQHPSHSYQLLKSEDCSADSRILLIYWFLLHSSDKDACILHLLLKYWFHFFFN